MVLRVDADVIGRNDWIESKENFQHSKQCLLICDYTVSQLKEGVSCVACKVGLGLNETRVSV
eukprot:4488750-Pleurochrysis_carterae.AAC.1